MNPVAHVTRWRALLITTCFVLATAGGVTTAADKAKIDEAIRKGQQFILKTRVTGPVGSVAALGYVKSGGDKHHEFVTTLINEIVAKVNSGTYKPIQHYNYEAGVDLMLLEAVDSEVYRPQMESITNFLLSTQQANGAWFYDHEIETDCGDTSITQYAILGLWASSRAGIPVPTEVWERAARWHVARQRDDGGFAYHPYDSKTQTDPEYRQSRVSMTAAGPSSLLIIRRVLFEESEFDTELRPAESKRRFGVLERFVDEKAGNKQVVLAPPTLRPGYIDKALKDSIKYTSSHYIDKGHRSELFFFYYLYCIERVAALMDVEMLGTKNWYTEGADEILKRQGADGSWLDSCGASAATSLSLMFLSKATTTIVAPKKRTSLLGGGLQTGGRGLPDNLGAVQVKEGMVSARKIAGPVDDLLIELERSSEAKVLEAQAAVVETIQLDQPEKLIGQIERLRKLTQDPRVEVRRTAYWALGRSGDISMAKNLIEGLMDPDLSVMREASLGLCILSRRPEGCGKQIDPGDDIQMGIKEDATDEERLAILSAWQKESKKRWTEWYMKVRPYDERDDQTTIRATNK